MSFGTLLCYTLVDAYAKAICKTPTVELMIDWNPRSLVELRRLF